MNKESRENIQYPVPYIEGGEIYKEYSQDLKIQALKERIDTLESLVIRLCEEVRCQNESR